MQPLGDSQLWSVSFRERYGTSYGRGIALPISGSAKGWTTSGTCRETCCQEVCANTVWTLCELWAEWSDWRFLFLLLCSVPSNGIVAACSFSVVDKKSALLNFCIYLPFLYLPLSLCFVTHGSNLSATFFLLLSFWTTLHVCGRVSKLAAYTWLTPGDIRCIFGQRIPRCKPAGMHDLWTCPSI